MYAETDSTKNEIPNARATRSKMLQNRRNSNSNSSSSSSFVDSCAYLITNIVFGWVFFSRSFFSVVIVTLCAVKSPKLNTSLSLTFNWSWLMFHRCVWRCVCVRHFSLRCSNSSITLRLLVLFHEWNTKWVNVYDARCFFLFRYTITGSEISAFSSHSIWFIQFPWMFMTH